MALMGWGRLGALTGSLHMSLTGYGPEVGPRRDDEEEDNDEHSCGRVIDGLPLAADAPVVRAVLCRRISAVGLEGLVRGRPENTFGMKLRLVAEFAWRHGECDKIRHFSKMFLIS